MLCFPGLLLPLSLTLWQAAVDPHLCQKLLDTGTSGSVFCRSWWAEGFVCALDKSVSPVLWYWRRLFRVPWTARRSNRLILKEINLEYSLEGLMLKLKLQYSGHLMWRAYRLEKTLMLGKTEGKRRRGWQKMRWLRASSIPWTWVWANSRRQWRTGKPGVLQPTGSQRVRHNWVTEQQQIIQKLWPLIFIQRIWKLTSIKKPIQRYLQ